MVEGFNGTEILVQSFSVCESCEEVVFEVVNQRVGISVCYLHLKNYK